MKRKILHRGLTLRCTYLLPLDFTHDPTYRNSVLNSSIKFECGLKCTYKKTIFILFQQKCQINITNFTCPTFSNCFHSKALHLILKEHCILSQISLRGAMAKWLEMLSPSDMVQKVRAQPVNDWKTLSTQ